MNLVQQFRFAMRQLGREWRAGELPILLLALIVAIASHTAINHFTVRISSAMANNANDIIGGDLALTGSRPATDAILNKAKQLALKQTHIVQFPSVISNGHDILLVSVKAVDADYPLKASLKTATELYGITQTSRSGPPTGEAWVEARVMRTLKLKPGDSFELGDMQLVASRILVFEPDRGRNFYSFTPRVLMSKRDLEKTGILQLGSRVRHRNMFAGTAEQIAEYRDWITPLLLPNQRVRGLDEERPEIAAMLDKAQQYMGLASLVALLLAAIAIAISGRQYSERHYDNSALLRCMGCKQHDILAIYTMQLSVLALIGGLLGNSAGWLAQAGLIATIAELLPENIAAAQWSTFYSGILLAFIVLIGFTLPSILRLKSVSPQRVLRKDLTPLPISAWLVYGGTALLVVAMMWFYTGKLSVTLATISGALVMLTTTALLLSALFALLHKLLPRLPIKIRTGMRNLLRRRQAVTLQTMALGLTITAMLIVLFIRIELIDAWQTALPEDAPNHFVLNIQQDDSKAYMHYLHHANIRAGSMHPVVRGRLTQLNDKPITEHVSKEKEHDESLRRDLNLTWSDTLPSNNELLEGQWWDPDTEEPLVSVESELAKRLHIKLNDKLTLFTGDQEWQARVSSTRVVHWDDFKPNFYMIFNRNALKHLPTTWMNSFQLDDKDRLAGLVKRFPSITLLEMDAIIEQISHITGQITLAIEAMLSFVLAAGVMVTLATMTTTMNERVREGALLRTLGANRALLRRNAWSEFAGIGMLSGLFGMLGAEIISALLYRYVFELDYAPMWWAWLVVPPLAGACIGSIGVMNSRCVLQQSPLIVLQQ